MMQPIRSALTAGAALLVGPPALSAHQGHAGDHGWLAGAMQPTLSLDHFLAGSFLAVVLTIGGIGVARVLRGRSTESTLEP